MSMITFQDADYVAKRLIFIVAPKENKLLNASPPILSKTAGVVFLYSIYLVNPTFLIEVLLSSDQSKPALFILKDVPLIGDTSQDDYINDNLEFYNLLKHSPNTITNPS